VGKLCRTSVFNLEPRVGHCDPNFPETANFSTLSKGKGRKESCRSSIRKLPPHISITQVFVSRRRLGFWSWLRPVIARKMGTTRPEILRRVWKLLAGVFGASKLNWNLHFAGQRSHNLTDWHNTFPFEARNLFIAFSFPSSLFLLIPSLSWFWFSI